MDVGQLYFQQLQVPDSDLVGIIGDRVYISLAVDGVFPHLVIDVDEEEVDSLGAPNLRSFTMNVTVQSLASAERHTIGELVYAALHRSVWTGDDCYVLSNVHSSSNDYTYVQDSGNVDRIIFIRNLEFSLKAGAIS
jgi:hypothetical protein